MSVRMISPDGDSQTPVSTHFTSDRVRQHRAALRYAEKEKLVFPCEPGGKRPLTRHGFKEATKDPRRINLWWTRWHGANIGMPTGERSGLFVVDVDRLEALRELEQELPTTLKIRTPSGGRHLYFKHVEGITNSPGSLPKGIDVRGEGGYVLLPPSSTGKGSYTVEVKAEIAEAPEWLLELIREKKPSAAAQPRGKKSGAIVEGGPIPEGARNRTLFFRALDLKDAGHEVLDTLLATNEARCAPPLDPVEVEKIAKSASRYPVRSGTPSPEVVEAIEKLEREWWQRRWPGVGGKTDRDVYRVLIELARKYGRLRPDGSVSVSASVRSVALAAATRYATISGGATKRLIAEGLLLGYELRFLSSAAI